MSGNIIEKTKDNNVELFIENVEWDGMRQQYIGDAVNRKGVSSMTDEMLINGDFDFITDSSEIWEVEEYTIRVCSQCDSKAMYDEQKQEYYCPKCDD